MIQHKKWANYTLECIYPMTTYKLGIDTLQDALDLTNTISRMEGSVIFNLKKSVGVKHLRLVK